MGQEVDHQGAGAGAQGPGNLLEGPTRVRHVMQHECQYRQVQATVLQRKGFQVPVQHLDVRQASESVAGLSEHLWQLEQPAHAVANGYFVGAINRVGREKPWDIGEFYGSSYFCDPYGRIIIQAARDKDEVVVADLDLDMIREVRNNWQFFRDRRPETYGGLVSP